jgi:hypothetical protein
MGDYDYIEEERPARKAFTVIFNVLTVFALLAIVCVVSVFLMIFINPNSALNPFPPRKLPTALALPTQTPTPRSFLEPTWTATPTLEPSATFTPRPTFTPFPTETPFNLATETPTATSQIAQGMPFEVSPGTPTGASSMLFHPEERCNWMGVAGQVFDLSGAPITGQVVMVGGFLEGKVVEIVTLTGLPTAYGANGFYEAFLSETPTASNGRLFVQLLDQAGLAMSDKVYFDTYAECERNLIFVNFKQVR